MEFTNVRLIVFFLALIIGVALVILIEDRAQPFGVNDFDPYSEHCSH